MNPLTNQVPRYLFALPFGVFGVIHFTNAGVLAGMVPIPGGVFWIYLTGLAHIAACISIIIEKYTRLAALLLGLMLLTFVLSVQLPGLIGAEDAQTMQIYMRGFLKDTALAGAAWFIAGQYTSDIATGSESSGPGSTAPEAGSRTSFGTTGEGEDF